MIVAKSHRVAPGNENRGLPKPGPIFIVGPLISSLLVVISTAILLRALEVTALGDGAVFGLLRGHAGGRREQHGQTQRNADSVAYAHARPQPAPTMDPATSAAWAAEAAAGRYELRIACRGDAESTVTVTAESPGAPPAVVAAPCDSTTQAMPFTMVNSGVTVTTAVEGTQPVDWASVVATQSAGWPITRSGIRPESGHRRGACQGGRHVLALALA